MFNRHKHRTISVPPTIQSLYPFEGVENYNKSLDAFIVGVRADGEPITISFSNSPHLLVAGCSGSGKSVFLNTLVCSLLLKKWANFIIIDPKRVEFIQYKSLPAVKKLATEPDEAIISLRYAHKEMMSRYDEMSRKRLRLSSARPLVVIFDEYASFVNDRNTAKQLVPVVNDIARLGRAARVHLVVSTQYPTSKIVDSQIKANIDTRVCFKTVNPQQSRVILDRTGAESLHGQGDGLIVLPNGYSTRFQGVMLSAREQENVIAYRMR